MTDYKDAGVDIEAGDAAVKHCNVSQRNSQ